MSTSAPQRAPGAPPLPHTPFQFVLFFVLQFRGWYAAILLFETANSVCGILIPYALSGIIKTVTTHQASDAGVVAGLQGPVWFFFVLCLGEVLFGRLAGAVQIYLGPRQRQNVTRHLYHYLQFHSHGYFNNHFAGALTHRINETSMGVTQTLWAVITEFWPITLVISISIVLLYRADPLLGQFVALWAVLYIGVSYWLAKRCQPYAQASAAAKSTTTGLIADSITNLTSARLFAAFDHERELLNQCLGREWIAVRRSTRYSERVRWFQFSAAAFLKAGILYFALSLWEQGRIGVAEFVMAVSLALLIITEARNLSRRFLDFFEYIGNVGNGVSTLVVAHDVIDAMDARTTQITQGAIELRNVYFSYENQMPVFRNLSVRIEPGQRVGLVGFSGSGKSTFVSLLLRMYDIQQGQILLDGIDIRTMSQDALRRQVSLIPQEPNLFHRTLRDNIRYGRLSADDRDVENAARMAHAEEFIRQIPEGYDALVGERGVKLSGGQRQRIAIARVILKDAPILILDEATSSLDSLTERVIQDTLETVMKDKTVLVVAHRLSTIAHLDRILVFDNGEIIEDGSHAELLARRGAYYNLWSHQSDGFLPMEAEHRA